MNKRMKRVLLLKLAPYFAIALALVLLVAMIAATIAEIESAINMDAADKNKKHEEEISDFVDQLEHFTISGTKSGNSYNLSFDFGSWKIKNIKFDLPDKKGKVTVNVKVPEHGGKGAKGAVQWALKIAADDSFCYGYKPATAKPGCYFCGTNQRNKPNGYEKTYVCMTFVHAAYAHGAKDPEMLADCQAGRYTLSLNDWNFSHWSCWKKIGLCKDLTVNDLRPGDVIIWWADDDASGHASLYAGNGDIVDAAIEGWGADSIAVRQGSAASYLNRGANFSSKSYVMRYIGPYGKGDSGASTAGTQKYHDATFTFDYTISGDKVTFNGKLDGTDIAGTFEANDSGKVTGEGDYGVGAAAGGTVGNPYGTKTFTVTSIGMAWRICPFHGREIHTGWDLASGGIGTPIYAVQSGVVETAGYIPGYGNHTVIIKSGSMYILYGHMSAMNVKVGDKVSAATRIGAQGSEGNSTGPHLHLEFRKGSNSSNAAIGNLAGMKPMMQRWAVNYKSITSEFSNIVR